MMANYIDIHRARMLQNGVTEKERIENKLAQDFQRVIKKSPDRVVITYNDQEYKTILSSGNSRVGLQTEKKVIQYLETARELKLPEGAVFTSIDEHSGGDRLYWIVLHREIHAYYGYFKYKIVELDYMIKYVDRNGVLKEIPAYINGTGEFDIKEYFKFGPATNAQVNNRALNLIIAANPDFHSDNEKSELRFTIGEESWYYVDSDKVSIPGVYYVTLFKDGRNPNTDNVGLQIADEDKIGSSYIQSSFGKSGNIYIDMNFKDLHFYYFNNGRDSKASFMFSDYNSEILDINGTDIIPIGIGVSELKVTDKISGLSRLYLVTVGDSMDDYCSLVGPSSGYIGTIFNFNVAASDEWNIEYDKDFFKNFVLNGNRFTLQSKDKIGKTKIKCLCENGLESIIEIDVTGLWVN